MTGINVSRFGVPKTAIFIWPYAAFCQISFWNDLSSWESVTFQMCVFCCLQVENWGTDLLNTKVLMIRSHFLEGVTFLGHVIETSLMESCTCHRRRCCFGGAPSPGRNPPPQARPPRPDPLPHDWDDQSCPGGARYLRWDMQRKPRVTLDLKGSFSALVQGRILYRFFAWFLARRAEKLACIKLNRRWSVEN